MAVGAVIVAGGKGSRCDSQTPKQYLSLCGVPLLVHAVKAFTQAPSIGELVVVARRGEEAACRHKVTDTLHSKLSITVVAGGERRRDSVRNGLNALGGGIHTVCVHDGARPLISSWAIEAALAQFFTQQLRALIFAAPLTDTVKKVSRGRVLKTLDRSTLWAVQTPQIFNRALLEAAHDTTGGQEATDDASLVESLGETVHVFDPQVPNFKVTHLADLALAEALLCPLSQGKAPA